MGVWLDRYKENEELRNALEKNVACKDNNLYCHPVCIAFNGGGFGLDSCSLFGELKYDQSEQESIRSNRCIEIFGSLAQ